MFIRSWYVVCYSNPSLRSTPSQDLQLTGESQMVLRTEQWTERGPPFSPSHGLCPTANFSGLSDDSYFFLASTVILFLLQALLDLRCSMNYLQCVSLARKSMHGFPLPTQD